MLCIKCHIPLYYCSLCFPDCINPCTILYGPQFPFQVYSAIKYTHGCAMELAIYKGINFYVHHHHLIVIRCYITKLTLNP